MKLQGKETYGITYLCLTMCRVCRYLQCHKLLRDVLGLTRVSSTFDSHTESSKCWEPVPGHVRHCLVGGLCLGSLWQLCSGTAELDIGAWSSCCLVVILECRPEFGVEPG